MNGARRGPAFLLALALVGCAPTVTPSPPGSASPVSGPPSTSAAAVTPAASAAAAGPPPPCPAPTAGPSSVPLTTAQPGWWRDRVFYEVFIRSFADSDGDGIGDLRGLISRLDQLNDGDPATTSDLGITALWLMPPFPSPSYHGYDVTSYTGINADYGSLADMRALVAAAHKRGMAVILDLPLNHTSKKDPWFVASEKGGGARADWYVWSSTPEGSNWFPDGKRYYYAAFGPDLPDLNVKEPEVTAELTKEASYWLTDVGVDGFRLDAAKYMIEDGATTENTPATHAWLGDLRRSLQARSPGALTLGEVWDTSPISASYVPDALDMTFDFTVASGYVDAAGSGDGSSIGRILARITTLYPLGGFGAFLTNHDQNRVASTLGSDPAKLRLAAEMLLTGPGVPFVYYGEEIGMTGQKPDERIRTPIRWDASSPAAGFSTHAPWETLSDDLASVNVLSQTTDATSLWSTYRDLIALRAAHPALATGSFAAVTSDTPNVVAALRTSGSATALVITNVSAAPASPTFSLPSGPLCGTPAATVVFGGSGPGGGDAPRAAPPTILPSGGFSGYAPLPVVPARSVVVVDLHP